MTISGTPGYMAPEQLNGKPADRAATIFAFGCVVYEMLTGRRAFPGDTMAAALAATAITEPKPVEGLPQGLDGLLRRCLRKDPARRAQSMADIRVALEDFERAARGEEAAGAPPAGAAAPSRLWWAATAAVFVAPAALATVHFREKPAPPPVPYRFQLHLPDKVSFTASGMVTLSPDGRHVALSAAGPEGPMVYIQDTDGGEARLMPGTHTGPATPPAFWSFDSRFLVFSSGNPELDKVEIATGAVERLCDKPTPAVGGSWNRDNTVIFGSNSTGLWRVSAAGGTPVPLTHPDAARHERSHQLPSFLPDGRHFIYLAMSTDAGQSGIYAAALDDGPRQAPRHIATTDFGARFVEGVAGGPSWLLYMREGQLVAQVFDADNLVLKGDSMPVPVRVGTAYQTPLFSASADLLVYRTGGSIRTAQFTWVDATTGNRVGTVGDPDEIGRSRLSPDETKVVYEILPKTATAKQDLWVMDLSRRASTRLTFGDTNYGSPIWSPDGSEIAYFKVAGGKAEIFKKRADGTGNEELLLQLDESVRPQSFSNDGKYLLFTRAKTPGFNVEQIGILPLEKGAKPLAFSNSAFDEGTASFSPDGKYVLYESNETGRYEVYMRPFSPDPGAPVGGKWMISSQGGSNPRWSADGKKIFWSDLTSEVTAADIDASHGIRAGTPVKLFNAGQVVAVPAYMTRRGQALYVLPFSRNAAEPLNVLVNWQSTLKRN